MGFRYFVRGVDAVIPSGSVDTYHGDIIDLWDTSHKNVDGNNGRAICIMDIGKQRKFLLYINGHELPILCVFFLLPLHIKKKMIVTKEKIMMDFFFWKWPFGWISFIMSDGMGSVKNMKIKYWLCKSSCKK